MPREIDQSTQRFHVGYDWGPIRCGDTKCLVSLRALCCHLWRDINNNTNRGRVLGKVSCTKNLPLGEYSGSRYEVKIQQLCSSSIYEPNIPISLCLSDSVQYRKGFIFEHRFYISAREKVRMLL